MAQSAAQVAVSMGRPQGWQPMTFQERGAAVPFTTPHLAGARLRAIGRAGPELVLPQVVGPGSVGILPWERVGTLCSPTLFDRRLGARLASLSRLTPAAVGAAVCAEAAAGLAGPDAQAAAAEARRQHEADIARARAELPPAGTGDQSADGLAALAELFAPIGLGAEAEAARLPRTLGAVLALADALGDPQRTGGAASEADLVAAVARRVAGMARGALLAARGLAADPAALLRRWTLAPDALADEVARAAWLLDGWAWLCRLWACSDERLGRPALTLPEMAALLPPLPREAAEGGAVPRAEVPEGLQNVLRGGDWRSGVTSQDMIARNERLLAGVLALPEGPS